MSAIEDARNAMVAAIAAALPSLKTVETHRGRFDNPQEIKRFAVKSPAVLVGCLGFKSLLREGGLNQLACKFAFYVIARDVPNTPREVYCQTIAEGLAALIKDADWGLSNALAPGAVDARNIYSAQVDQLGVGLWGLSFEQAFAVDAMSDADYQALNAFITFHEDTDMAPADGQIDISETDTLPQ